jgi:hypothetical protein
VKRFNKISKNDGIALLALDPSETQRQLFHHSKVFGGSWSYSSHRLAAITDNLGLLEFFKEFVDFVMGKETRKPIVFQDCKSVISLVTIEGGNTRTKHLRARMNLGKEMVDEGRVQVVYVKAEEMKADGFSKPLDPSGHCKFVDLMQN